MGEESKTPEYVSVNCPTCGTRVTDSVREKAYQVKCPDCFEPVKIPSRKSVLKKMEQQERLKLKTEDAGTYGLSAVPQQPKGIGSFAIEEEAAAVPEFILLNCEMCNARLHPEVKEESYHLTCPDCHSELRVPAEWEVPSESKKKKKPKQENHDPGSYDMGAAEEPTPTGSDYYEKREAIRQVEIDPPPNWAFFSNVFQFPWMEGTLSRWVFMSMLFETIGLLVTYTWFLAQRISGPFFLVVPLFGFAALCFSLWAVIYSSACLLPVVIDTAAGNNRVHSWPEPNWREWMLQWFYVGYLASVAALGGLVGGTIAEASGGSFWLTFCIVNYLIYPVMLLSSLEAGSAFIPLTVPILKCMFTHWWCWLLFYLEMTFLWGVWVGLLAFGLLRSPYLTIMLAGLMLSSNLLISARLLGRLAWRAGLTDDSEDEAAGEQQA